MPDDPKGTVKPPAPSPEHKSEIKDPVLLENLSEGKTDPEGRVKQVDSVGNFLADENELRKTPRPQAPAIQTNANDTFNRVKMAELERQIQEAETLQGNRRLQAQAQLRAQLRELRERENRTISGADIRAPRGSILHAEEAVKQRPDFHYRFININAPGKAENAQALGYERVPSDEGGKQLGDLALFRQPLAKRAERVGAQDLSTRAKLDSVKKELQGEVQEVVDWLKRKGYDVSLNRLLVNEEG